jgi:hypothetical protein
VGKPVIDLDWWRRRRPRRLDAPAKGHIFASTDELLAERLRQVRLPEPPPALRERHLRTYGDWLNSRGGRNRWRDGG